MAISQDAIRRHGLAGTLRGPRTLVEARLRAAPTAFLSHSHRDAELAKGLQSYLQANGWEVYIDWEDTAMPDVPNRATASRIQSKIRELDLFLFLATRNSTASRWCPWELGYADGVKALNEIAIIVTSDAQGGTYGNEYLQLYNHIDHASHAGITAYYSNGRSRTLQGHVTP